MFVIDVLIVRWVSDDQPGIVECRHTDRFGRVWLFIEKSSVVSSRPLNRQSTYPQPGHVAVQVIKFGRDEIGREIAEVDSEVPWGVAADDGTTRFHIFADQLRELADR